MARKAAKAGRRAVDRRAPRARTQGPRRGAGRSRRTVRGGGPKTRRRSAAPWRSRSTRSRRGSRAPARRARPDPPLGRRCACRSRSTTRTWSRSSGPTPKMPELFVGPAPRAPPAPRLLAHRPAHERARGRAGDRLLHALPRPREGLVLPRACPTPKTRRAQEEPARRGARGLPARGEDQRDARHAAGAASSSPRWRIIAVDNPMCPGTGHRICNDCMKACIFQKQEPVNIPQIETRVLTETLDLPWGLEIYELLTRWNPLNVERPACAPYNGKNVLVVGPRPGRATRSPTTWRARASASSAIDGLKIEPLDPWLVGGAANRRRRPIETVVDALRRARRARASSASAASASTASPSAGTRTSSRSSTLTLARNPNVKHLRRRALRRHDHARRRVGARLRPRRDLGGRGPADDHRHEEQPVARHPQGQRLLDGAAAHRRLQAHEHREPAGEPARDRHRRRPHGDRHGDRAARLLPGAGREGARALRAARRGAGTPRPSSARGSTTRSGWRSSGTSRTAAQLRDEKSARARPRGASRDVQKLLDSWGGVTLVYRKGLNDSPAYRLNHEEVAKSLEEGVRYVEHMSPLEAVLDERGARQGRCASSATDGEHASTCRPARCASPPARARTSSTRRSTRAPSSSTSESSTSARTRPRVDGDGPRHARAGERGEGVLHELPEGRRRPCRSTATTTRTTPAASSRRWRARRTATRTSSRSSPRSRALDAATQPARDAQLRALFAKLDDELVATRPPGEPPDADHRRDRRARADGGAQVPARAVLPAAELRDVRARRDGRSEGRRRGDLDVARRRGSPWRGSRSPAPGSTRRRACSGRSSSRWAAARGSARRSLPGEPIVLMGPTGQPTEIASKETVLLCGGGLGNAVLFSIARAFKALGGARALLRRLPARRGPLQARRHRALHRPDHLVHRRRARPSSRAARRTGTSAATSSRRWRRTATGALGGPAGDPVQGGRAASSPSAATA